MNRQECIDAAIKAAIKATNKQTACTEDALKNLYAHIRSLCAILGKFPEYDLEKFESSIDLLELWMRDIHGYSECFQNPSSAGMAIGATVYAFKVVKEMALVLVDRRIKNLETFLVNCDSTVATAVTKLKNTCVEVNRVVDEAIKATEQAYGILGRQ